MTKIRCKVSYRSLRAHVATFAVGVSNGIFTNTGTFTSPPIAQATLDALILDCNTKYGQYKGHVVTKTEMLVARDALITGLDTMSQYVDSVALGNETVIGLSGFEATKGSASEQVPPAKPEGVEFTRTNTGELTTDCPKIAGAEFYGAIFIRNNQIPAGIMINEGGQIVVNDGGDGTPPGPAAPGPGVPEMKYILDFNKSRRKKFIGLEPGVTYWVYYYAVNTAGVSPLSDGVSFLLW